MSLRFLKLFAGLALLLLISGPASAPASAQGIFTVSGIHVDATAASSSEALNIAIAEGRPKAWTVLYRRLTRQQDWGRQPNLDGATLLRLSRGYNIANERRSTTRYVADVTYNFNPEAVARILQSAGIAYTQAVARRSLLVPMAPGFTTGAWAQSLAAASRDSLVPFTLAANADVPATLGFDAANWNDVAAAAGKIKATDAALVQVVPAGAKLVVNIRRLTASGAPIKTTVDVPLGGNTTAAYAAAAEAAVHAIEDMWKSRSALDSNQRGKLNVVVRAVNGSQWGAIRSALSSVDNVTAVEVTAMDIGYAQLSLSYQGSTDQLRQAMSEAGLALTGQGGAWTLALGP